jgi:hypothetical protein
VGVAYALGWGVNLADQAFALVPALAGNSGHLAGYPGEVLTGLVFGAASTFAAKLFNGVGAWQVHGQAAAKALNKPAAKPAAAKPVRRRKVVRTITPEDLA